MTINFSSGHLSEFESSYISQVIASMDDSLEAPGSITCKTDNNLEEEDEQQSDEEDGGLDWTKLLFVLIIGFTFPDVSS